MDRADRDAWRPQSFGSSGPRRIRDALVEPLWAGIRALAHVTAGGPVRLVDPDGFDLSPGYPEVAESLRKAVAADRLVLDGYLTDQATRGSVGLPTGEVEVPGAGEMAAHFFLGGAAAEVVSGGAAPARRTKRSLDPALERAAGAVAYVAVDLVALDDEVLLDVPLLERKRLLESALTETDIVRRTPYVRLPVGSFLSSWRAQGFTNLAYKSANSRYQPGRPNRDWAHVAIPRR